MSNVVPFTARTDRPQLRDTTSTPVVTSRASSTPTPIGRAVYTVKETAHMLSLSLGSTYALIRSGEIPAIKLGGRWAIPKRRFHEWLDNLPEATTDDVRRELDRLDQADTRHQRRNA
ncbi:helix-turn-helix domain-containing protein [Polymorphospora sp. NPDC051019]|uniref:helix-turn-helix domain-containing protein n=1 Tax=Polymorphospora sp. NPDC051019 TaxID=3155725 RepID=UPI003433FBB8